MSKEETSLHDQTKNCCLHWVRMSEETGNSREYGLSLHAPSCGNYKEEKYIKIIYGNTLILPLSEMQDFLNEIADEDEVYEMSLVLLTKDQHEALPEWDGF